ncbi:hypothetical protein F4820DRAFT_71303 [Hypoxylon rubiginosum]|uniref:Uncharacterized protein n=1 Tax=Hypoxylon rubiginosum TaxID=110542 RepID=A0ACB9YQ33_9PEZI|nr:hypothetical protein F4820DRAFT_71303 [Hypoxylon rubiginosum]
MICLHGGGICLAWALDILWCIYRKTVSRGACMIACTAPPGRIRVAILQIYWSPRYRCYGLRSDIIMRHSAIEVPLACIGRVTVVLPVKGKSLKMHEQVGIIGWAPRDARPHKR